MQLKTTIVPDIATEEAINTYSEDIHLDSQMNVRIVQNVLLIWLDQHIDENNADCRNTIKQLRSIVNNINKFTDADICMQFFETASNEKICIIVSGSLGQHIVPHIHHMSQLDSIFIFCDDKEYHKQWVTEWSKIKGIYTDIQPICEALKQAAQQCEYNAISISIMTADDLSTKNLDKLDSSFMYLQIMKEILLEIDFEEKHFQQYIDYCREVFGRNDHELKNVRKLEREYQDQKKTPIWWYTLETFLYPMVNRGLRLIDVDIIIKMGFFIKDLHNHIEQLHNEQFGDARSSEDFVVYRGQGMERTEFEQMTKAMGGLISFNNFLSTSTNRSVSSSFAQRALTNPTAVGVLFIMIVDPSRSTAPFAAIKDVSAIRSENEVLFAMQIVFRIGNITSMNGNPRLYQVELTLTSDDDKDLRQLTNQIRKETFLNEQGWQRFGEVLRRMGHFDKAEEIYQILLAQSVSEKDKGLIYLRIGMTKDHQGQYKEAITCYENALEIFKENYPPTNYNLACTYNNIGLVYDNMGEYPKALSYYQKALAIQQQSLPPTHLTLACTYNNIGNVYDNMGEYSKALLYYEKALEIRKQLLPRNHPDLAAAYINIGNVYNNMSEYFKALPSYKKALEIQRQSLPPTHPTLASSFNNIGIMYDKMGEYSKALSSYEKALDIRKQALSSNHPDLAVSYNNIGLVYNNIGEYSKAFSSYEKALEIRTQALSSNHPDLASSHNNIGNVYNNMGEYFKALSYYEKALEIQKQSLPTNHPDLAGSYNNIGSVYKNMSEYSKALSSHEKALEIQQQVFSSNHPDLADSYNSIGIVYNNIGEYSKALSYHQKALEVRKQSLPPHHPDLAGVYNNIGSVYYNMGEYSKALSSYERALEIQQQSLPPNHPDLAVSHNNIGNVFYSISEYSTALPYYEKALEIKQQSLPANHPELASSYGNIGLLCEQVGNYSKAHSYFERAFQIVQQSLPATHPIIRQHQDNLERIKLKLY